MYKSILRFGLTLFAITLLAGCTGNDPNNPGRYYLESNAPYSLQQVAQNMPSGTLPQEATIKLYAYKDGQRQLVKTEKYAAHTVSAAQIVRDLPVSGHYYVEAELKGSMSTLTYQAELNDAQLTIH